MFSWADTVRAQANRRHADIERIELELARLTATGRHPDQWLERHAHAVADGLAAHAEHDQRREAEIDRQAARAALDPPAHVRDMLGEHPTSGAKLTQAWQRLAIALERYRLQYGIDVAKDGSLGPSPVDPTVRATIAYRHDRDRLARDIARLRHQRGLGPHPQLPDPRARQLPDRGPGPGR
jgi:hypothetical protein